MRQIALLQRGVDQRAPAVVRLDEKLLVVVIVGGAQGRIEQVRADLGDDEQLLGRGLATAVLIDGIEERADRELVAVVKVLVVSRAHFQDIR